MSEKEKEEDKEAVRAAAMQELEQLTSSLSTAEPSDVGRYKDAWDEESWEKDFDNHPLFMTTSPEDPANLPPLVEAMRQLKYDPEQNTASDLADRYKRDGNENYRLKKYRWAADNYTAGIKQGADDDELNSMLYGNRAAAHMRLGNYRSALNDSRHSVRLSNGKNHKSVMRIAECYFNLKDYHSCVKYCKHNILDHESLESCLKRAQQELTFAEQEAKIQQAKIQSESDHRQQLMQIVLKDRRIDLRGDLFHSHHPAAGGQHHVQLAQEEGRQELHLMWPVIFVYPEFSQCDLIERFDEEATFRQQLQQMFGDEDQRPAWDADHRYTPNRMKIAFPRFDAPDHMIPVDLDAKLRHVLSSPDYKLVDACPMFVVVATR